MLSMKKIMNLILVLTLAFLFTSKGIEADIDNNFIDIPEYYMYNGVKVYRNELTCTMSGGVCVETEDCAELTSTRGLCPSNAHLGVECCYEMILHFPDSN